MAESGSIAVPLMVLVIIEFARVARELDLEELAGKRAWTGPMAEKENQQFGIYPVFYGINYGLCLLTFTMPLPQITWDFEYLFSNQTIPVSLSLLIISAIILFLFPLIQVEEYSRIPPDNLEGVPLSYSTHFVISGLHIVLACVASYLYTNHGAPISQDPVTDFPIPELQLLIIILTAVLFVAVVYYHPKHLKKEILLD